MEHILEQYSLKKRYWYGGFGVKMVDFLVEHKRLTKIGDNYICNISAPQDN
jgi:hypothetical protein